MFPDILAITMDDVAKAWREVSYEDREKIVRNLSQRVVSHPAAVDAAFMIFLHAAIKKGLKCQS